ncbi:hypothetical protein LQ327_17675 [Actinomycetospora endophytica]|uniref:Uncharacterized protein n=1 Tax=Actinomycetospora endophytica TaxID=2291215 RepID=A0ABS8PCI1_9PSEU|nr:hypothetical protein [Actinomycetospora endophytica]MCD2195200.1 hypothetical protein [Actinomycetospora endophytica]
MTGRATVRRESGGGVVHGGERAHTSGSGVPTRRREVSLEVLWQRPRGTRRAGEPAVVAPPRDEALVAVTDPEVRCRVLMSLSATTTTWQLDSLEVCRDRDGPPIDAAMMQRIPVHDYLGLANRRLITSSRPVDGATRPATAPARQRAEPRVRRSAVDADMLRRVATVYRRALASTAPRERQAPTAAVARHFAVPRANAARLVAWARVEGFLDAALPRRAGEAGAD